MSIDVMSKVWKYSSLSGTNLLLMLAIADHAHDDGSGAYPGVKRLAKKCRLNRRTIQRAIQSCIESGELSVYFNGGIETAHGKTNAYTINLDKLGGDKLSPGDTHVTPGVTPTSPKPSVEPSDSSSSNNADFEKKVSIFFLEYLYPTRKGEIIAQQIDDCISDYPQEVIEYAIDETIKSGVTTPRYFYEICDNPNRGKPQKRKSSNGTHKSQTKPSSKPTGSTLNDDFGLDPYTGEYVAPDGKRFDIDTHDLSDLRATYGIGVS